jgi:beta-N-acetylhexosaminidase
VLLIAAEEATQLVLDLQSIAHRAGHRVPLSIALDQENGGVNSLFDDVYIRQFPSAMGLAATGSKQLAREVAKATGQELNAVGVNWILGPVLDVLTNVRNQPLGVRTTGDDPQEVSSYGVEFLRGYHEAGLATCGKHFPSYGNLEFRGAQTDVPVITDSLEQLSQSALIPFRAAIAQGLDAVMVGGVAMKSNNMDVMHACLSDQIVQDLLRVEMPFNGVVVSECLEMEALSHNIGLGGGTVMAIKAGCDIALLCRSITVQEEAINGLRLGVENGIISRSRVEQSLRRVLDMKSKTTSWEKALNPGGINYLTQLKLIHTNLSDAAYSGSITVVRDQKQLLPLSKLLREDEELLLLTPLLKPLPASAAYRKLSETPEGTTPERSSAWDQTSSIMSGERVFREFGRAMSRQRGGRVLHTSYTANGLRPMHEDLIDRAGAVVVVTADAGRNRYQNGFTKHVSMICRMSATSSDDEREKPFIVVSVSSPYDFAFDQTIGTYVCTYDFTEAALQALVKVLFGELKSTGALPGSMNAAQKLQQSRQHWLVENWNEERDSHPLDMLLRSTREGWSSSQQSILSGVSPKSFLLRSADIEESHFVVRNSSTKELYGFCSTYYFRSTAVGVVGSIIVHPNRRKLSIGHSLYNRAMQSLAQKKGIKKWQLGARLPSIFLGIPTFNPSEYKKVKQWFINMGWKIAASHMLSSLILRNLPMWSPPEGLSQTLSNPDIKFDLVYGTEYAETILDHVKTNSTTGVQEIYKLALAEKASCGIIRAKRPDDGFILGTVVLYKSDSRLAEFVPALADTKVLTGGISSPVISPSVNYSASLMQGLILLGIRQIKKQGANAVVLDCVRKGCSKRKACTDCGRLRMTEGLKVCFQWVLTLSIPLRRLPARLLPGPCCRCPEGSTLLHTPR